MSKADEEIKYHKKKCFFVTSVKKNYLFLIQFVSPGLAYSPIELFINGWRSRVGKSLQNSSALNEHFIAQEIVLLELVG